MFKTSLAIGSAGLVVAAGLAVVQVQADAPCIENSNTGAMGVKVTDIHDQRIEGARVALTHQSTGNQFNTQLTGKDGTTFFTDLKPGPYVVVATHPDAGEGKRLAKVLRYRKTRVSVVVRP